MPRDWLKQIALAVTLAFLSGGVYMFYNFQTKADAAVEIDTAKKEIREDYRREDDELKKNFTRQVDLLNQSILKLIDILDKEDK